jgi:NAD(P)-dependent dehydrogenase (short-subunit alcohol dehydrogenase family)
MINTSSEWADMVDLIRDSIAGKTAVILGVGPGQGIATVRMFINFGAKVAIVSRSGNSYGLAESSTIHIYKSDVFDLQNLKDLRERILKDYGRIDFLHNSVGTWHLDTEDFPDESEIISIMKTNLISQYNALNVFSQAMRKEGGSIVNVGASPHVFNSGHIGYNMSKAAIEELTRSSARKLRRYNVRVNAILPGLMSKEDNYFKNFPFKFPGLSEDKPLESGEIAMVSVFLCSEMAHGINGQSIIVDRGFSLGRA